jgi:hypothetical protein
MGMMVFHPKSSGTDLASLFGELAAQRWPELLVQQAGAPQVGPLPRVQAGLVPIVPPDRQSLDDGCHGLTSGDRDALRRLRTAFVMGFLSTPSGWLPH